MRIFYKRDPYKAISPIDFFRLRDGQITHLGLAEVQPPQAGQGAPGLRGLVRAALQPAHDSRLDEPREVLDFGASEHQGPHMHRRDLAGDEILKNPLMGKTTFWTSENMSSHECCFRSVEKCVGGNVCMVPAHRLQVCFDCKNYVFEKKDDWCLIGFCGFMRNNPSEVYVTPIKTNSSLQTQKPFSHKKHTILKLP